MYGGDEVENFKNNSLFFAQKYKKPDESVKVVRLAEIKPGGFYFLHYLDDSNWLKFAPVFLVDFRKFDNKVILIAVNFNFIPMEIRAQIFDNYITNDDFEKNNYLKVDYEGMYRELLKVGFEYALMEFNAAQIKIVHRIHLELLPRFLYAQHPINKYDPKKLVEIWQAKLDKREQRHKEIISSILSEYYDITKEISEKYDLMRDHIKRIQTSLTKYGRM